MSIDGVRLGVKKEGDAGGVLRWLVRDEVLAEENLE